MSNDILRSSSPSSSWALSIPTVLESVLEKMNKEDLFACRFVCQSWAKEAGRIIGKRVDKKVTALDQLETLRTIQICSDISILLKTLRIENPASFKINQSFSQSYSTIMSLDLRCSPSLVPNLLVNIFPNLESLTLRKPYNVRNNGLVAFPAVVWENAEFPRLRNLTVFGYSDGVWMSLVDKLLEKAGNLEFVGVYQVTDSPVATLFANVCSSSLKSITVSLYYFHHISEIFFTALRNHPIIFPLETFDLQFIDNATVSKSDIKLLLTRFSSTLGQLQLQFRGMFEMNFPLGVPMKKLHYLRLGEFRGSMEWRNLPQLKKLILLNSSIERIAASISSTPSYCHLEALHIRYTQDDEHNFIFSFRKFAEYLGPQLKSLELCNVDVSLESWLPVVFTYLTQLNHLSVEEGFSRWGIKDKDLCGTDFLSFQPLMERSLGVPLNEAYQRMIASAKKSNHVRGPNITNLKDLQFLSVGGKFSQAAVLHGIVQCEKLRELYLNFPDEGNTRDTIVHLLVNAGLQHLTAVELNYERINPVSFAPKSSSAGNWFQRFF